VDGTGSIGRLTRSDFGPSAPCSPCGRELCCSTFLPRFAPVSIKMAKHQNLAMSPTKVSGQCGRLKCCLVYEDASYVEAAAALPRVGRRVETPDGAGRVDQRAA
jgi:cell fate regulator YaaT (PSP1 superfamily)